MLRVTCPRCLACFGENDEAWQQARARAACPYCGRRLDVHDPAFQLDLTRSDPDSLLMKAFGFAITLAMVLAVAIPAALAVAWFVAVGLTALWLVLRPLLAPIAVALAVVAALFLALLLLKWLNRPLRHRGRRFEHFHLFLDSWAESFDRGASIFVEPEAPRLPRLRFRLVGRGARKRLTVRLPHRRASSRALLAELESLIGLFEDVALRERPRSFELSLPAQAPYTGSLASRAARAAFESLGCTAESTFTIYGESRGFDPYYELRLYQRLAERPGLLQRYAEKRARRLRAALRQKGQGPPGAP